MKRVLLLLVCFCTIAAFGQAPTNGLIAYYPFNGNADDAAGANHGSVNGATLTTDRHGNANSAYSFDGVDDNISTTFKPSNIFSISVWFNAAENQPFNSGLFSTYEATNFNGIYVGFQASYPAFTQYTDGNQGGALNFSSYNSLQHLVITSDGSTVRTYVNGVNQMGVSNTTTHASNIVFGDSKFNDRFFKGSLDDIRIYDRVLIESEVQALYNAEKPQVALVTPATISSNAPSLCVGQTLTLTVNNPENLNYTITGPKGLVANLTIPNVTSADAGTYTIESSDIGGTIIGSESIQITVMPPMAITFTGGATSLQQNPANTTYTTNVPDATFSLSPAEAGAIDPMTGEVNWSDTFVGTVTITATSDMPPCGAVGARVVEITAISACIAPTFIQNSSSTATSFYPYTLGVIGNSFVFRYRQLGATDWTEMPAVLAVDEGGIGTTITGLTNNTVYEFQVKQLCATGGESDYSTTKTANTFCQTFNSYNLNATNVTTTTANIQWANNFGVPLKANIRYRKIGDVDWVTKTEVTETVVDYLTNHTLTGLDENSNYEYQIQAVCLDGSTSDFGDSKNFTTLAAPVESQNPIAMYPLNGDANDTSGNNFHGVVNGAAGFVTGVQGQALHINVGVSQYVWIPNNIQFDNIIKVSLAAWVKPQTFNLDCWSEREMIIGKGQDEVANGYGISIQRNSNSASCGEAASFDQYKFNFEYGGKSVSTPFYPVDNKWRYVTGTYDNNILKIYVNGQLVAEQTEGLLDSKNTLPMWFNHATWNGGNSTAGRFGGDLDNIRIYNRAISATEVLDIYNAEKPQVALVTPATMTSNADNTLFCMGNPLIFTVNNPDNVDYIIKDFAGQVVSNLTVPFAMSGNYTIESFNPITGESLGIYTHNVTTYPPMSITFTGPTTVEQNAANTTYLPSFAGASMSLIPAEAGSIDGYSGVVDWNENFFGVATISAQMPPCGSGSIQVTVNQVIQTLTATAQSVILCAKSNLELKVTPSGGVGGNTYAWSGPNGYTNTVDQNPILPYVESGPSLAGTYLVTVTDGGGATATASVVVSLSTKPEILINPIILPKTDCNNSIASISVIATGGDGQFTFTYTTWKNTIPQIIANNEYSTADLGYNYIQAVDGEGCKSEKQFVVPYYSPFVASVNWNEPKSQLICQNGNFQLLGSHNTVIDAVMSYKWSGPNNFSSTDQNPVISNFDLSKSGEYSLLVTHANGCKSTDNDLILNNPSLGLLGKIALNLNPNSSPIIFTSGADALYINAPNTTYTTDAVNPAQVSYTLAPWNAGTISPEGVVDWDDNFVGDATITANLNVECGGTATKTVTIIQNLTATIGTITPSNCEGPNVGAVEIIPSGGNAPYTITPAQTGLAVGTHTFLVTDADLNTKEVVVEIPNVTLGVTWSGSTNSGGYPYLNKTVCKNVPNENILIFNSPLVITGTHEIEYRLNRNSPPFGQTVEIASLIVTTAGEGKFSFTPTGDNTSYNFQIISIKIGNCKYPVQQWGQVTTQTPQVPNIISCPGPQTITLQNGATTGTLNFNWYVNNILSNGIRYAQNYTVAGATTASGNGDGRPTFGDPNLGYSEIPTVVFNIGLSHYTITTNDGCNPPESCTFDVTVIQDLNAPVITCPTNIVKPTDIDQETALVTFDLPTATDDNGTPLITQIAGPPSGTQFPKGETTISFLATDVSGNTASCSFTVLVYDDGIPTVVNTETPATLPQGSDTYNLPPALIDVEVPINGDVIGIQITEFPDGATSITIDGQEYGPPTESPNMAKGVASLGVSFAIIPFPVGGVFVPTTNLGVPTVSISVKPNIVNGESVTVVIPYVAVNSQQAQSPLTATITLNFEQPLIATISKIINITCFGANNGSVEITIIGGNSPYTIDKALTQLTPGSHLFLVTDKNGATTSVSATITEPSAPLLLSFSENTLACEGNLASAKINISGGTEVYQVTVSQGATVEGGYVRGLAGDYIVNVIDANGCSTSGAITFTACIESNVICTTTQNGYGNVNYLACAEDGTTKSVGSLLSNALGLNPKVFGLAANNRTFTLSPSDLSSNIYQMLSGVSNASSKFGLGGASYGVTSTWPRVPLTNQGKIANNLFAHSIALYFNLQNSSKLDNVQLSSPILHTESTLSCGSATGSGVVGSYQLPTAVVSFLNNNSMGYAPTVAGLFQLNNDALGGKAGLPNLSTLAATADKVNKAFNGCRLMVSQPANITTFGTNIRVNEGKNGFDAPAKGGLYMTLIEGDPATGHILGVVDVNNMGETGFAPVITNSYHVVLGTDPEGSRNPQAPAGYRIVSQVVNANGVSFASGGTQVGTGLVAIGTYNPQASARAAAADGYEIVFTLEAIAGPLPIRLISFEGKASEKGNELNWKTSSEINFSHFEVERSIDAKTFEKIGRVEGAGNANEKMSYNFVDKLNGTVMVPGASITTNNTDFYYRLKLIDLDEKSDYSKVIYLNKVENSEIKVYPNPATDIINIENLDGKYLTIRVLDDLGREIIGQIKSNSQIVKIPIVNISTGTYFIQIQDKKQTIYKKVIVNK